MSRLVRELLQDIRSDSYHWKKTALNALHTAAEAMITEVCQDAAEYSYLSNPLALGPKPVHMLAALNKHEMFRKSDMTQIFGKYDFLSRKMRKVALAEDAKKSVKNAKRAKLNKKLTNLVTVPVSILVTPTAKVATVAEPTGDEIDIIAGASSPIEYGSD
jgi:hypothetical protein